MNIDQTHNYNRDGGKSTRVKYISILGSPAHTYGNALAYIENWIVNLFPKDFFKTFHINSKLASRQLRATKHEHLKKERPMLVLRPRIDYEGSEFLRNTPLTTRMSDIAPYYDYGALQQFFKDDHNRFEVRYQMNRYSLYVDCVVVVSTLIQQVNMMHYIKEASRVNIPFLLQTCFESYIPSDLIEVISKMSGIPVKNEEGYTSDFLSYMNQNSAFPVTYKLQGSTGNMEFFRYYPVRIDTMLSDLSADDGEQHGQITTHYQISFTIKMEFNTSGMYFLFSNEDIPWCDPSINPSLSPNTNLVPLFTEILLKEDYLLQPGWHVWKSASVILEKKNDVVEFRELLNNSIELAIEYYMKNGLPVEEIVDIKIRRQGELLHYGEEYIIDYKNFKICFQNDVYGFYTYRIIIAVCIEKINELIKVVYNLE